MSCELWCRPAAVAPIQPLAREPPYATGGALKTKKDKGKQPTEWDKIFANNAAHQGSIPKIYKHSTTQQQQKTNQQTTQSINGQKT